MDVVTSTCDGMKEVIQQKKHSWTRGERQLIRSFADGLEAHDESRVSTSKW